MVWEQVRRAVVCDVDEFLFDETGLMTNAMSTQ